MKFSVKLHNQKIVISKAGESECRYGLYDFEYEHQCQGTTEVSKKQKLFLMSWCPDTARIKKKMLYSSSFDALKKALVGVHKYIQVSIVITQSRTSQEMDRPLFAISVRGHSKTTWTTEGGFVV